MSHSARQDGITGISIVLPIYIRQADDLRKSQISRCLDSIFDQKVSLRSEVIIVDDGSEVLVEQLLANRHRTHQAVKVRRLRRNQGLVSALNVGINLARYSLIARIDDDDYWLPNKMEKQLAELLGDEDLTLIGTGMERKTADGKLIDRHVRPKSWHDILDFFVNVGCPFPHGSVVGRTRIFRELCGYSNDLWSRHAEDYELWGRWIRFFKPTMIEEVLYSYTVSVNSMSGLHHEHQARASGLIASRMKNLENLTAIPGMIADFAHITGLSLVEAGILLHRIWRFGGACTIPKEAYELVVRLLPDRLLSMRQQGNELALATSVRIRAL